MKYTVYKPLFSRKICPDQALTVTGGHLSTEERGAPGLIALGDGKREKKGNSLLLYLGARDFSCAVYSRTREGSSFDTLETKMAACVTD